MDMNNTNLVGRLADDMKFTPATETHNSRAVGRLIVNRPPNNTGRRQFDVIPLVAWGKTAENMAAYTSKGKEIAIIDGRLQTNSIPPQKPGDEWKNFFEVRVTKFSLGRDSSTAKMMKVIQGGQAVFDEALTAGGPGVTSPTQAPVSGNPLADQLAANPNLAAQLQQIVNAYKNQG